jgi:hypothetical protein
MRHDPGLSAGSGETLLVTTEQKASSPSLSGPSVTFASHGGIVVSSLVSSVYVRLRSLVFGLIRRCSPPPVPHQPLLASTATPTVLASNRPLKSLTQPS